MPLTIIDFPADQAVVDPLPRTHNVYWRANWADAWQLDTTLHCLQATWSIAPTVPTALISFLYGRERFPGVPLGGNNGMIDYVKKTGAEVERVYVKIEFDTSWDDVGGEYRKRPWVGVIELEGDQQWGHDPITTGEQQLQAFGMEKLLNDAPILSSYYWNGAAVVRTAGPIPFNENGIANRDLANGVFSGLLTGNDYWSTLQIVPYLLTYNVQRNDTGTVSVPFELEAGAYLPEWDRPELPTDGATVGSLINRLVDRRRMLTWHAVYDEDNNKMLMRVRTINKADVPLLAGVPIPENPDRTWLRYESDPMTQGAVTSDLTTLCDQCIAWGAMRTSTCTLRVDGLELEKSWETAAEEAYHFAASTLPGYLVLVNRLRQTWNDRVRRAPLLRDVYSKFRIPLAWDRQAKGGTGVAVPVFPDPAVDPASHPVYLPHCKLQPTLPLYEGVDYSGDRISTGAAELSAAELSVKRQLRPFAVFKSQSTEETGWFAGDHLEGAIASRPTIDGGDHAVSVGVDVDANTRSIHLSVSGGNQHDIAFGDFAPLSEDTPSSPFTFSGGEMLVTMSLTDDRRAEAIFPAVPPVRDTVRYKVIYAGDDFRQDWVVPGTVVGVAADKTLMISDGGFFADASLALGNIARQGYNWYGVPHRALSLRTSRYLDLSEAALGQIVEKVGDVDSHEIETNAIVAELTISWPRTEPGSRVGPTLHMETWAGDIAPTDTPVNPVPGAAAFAGDILLGGLA